MIILSQTQKALRLTKLAPRHLILIAAPRSVPALRVAIVRPGELLQPIGH